MAYYSLKAILAVGYWVRSPRETQFRCWANKRLTDYLVKGFTLDDDRLKNPPVADSAVPDRFHELLERIRDIRASERRMYCGCARCSRRRRTARPRCPKPPGSSASSSTSCTFAVIGQTVAKLIAERADSHRPSMETTTLKSGSVQKADVTVAKSYLQESEISEFTRVVRMCLDFTDDQARFHIGARSGGLSVPQATWVGPLWLG